MNNQKKNKNKIENQVSQYPAQQQNYLIKYCSFHELSDLEKELEIWDSFTISERLVIMASGIRSRFEELLNEKTGNKNEERYEVANLSKYATYNHSSVELSNIGNINYTLPEGKELLYAEKKLAILQFVRREREIDITHVMDHLNLCAKDAAYILNKLVVANLLKKEKYFTCNDYYYRIPTLDEIKSISNIRLLLEVSN